MVFSPVFKATIFSTALFALAACDSAEERAETHYASAIDLISQGDTDRALVELRNVLSLNEFHREARTTYARVARERGNLAEAYAQYLRIAEEDPADMESRLALSEMAIAAQNWSEAVRHSDALKQANVELEGTEIVDFVMRFREAIVEDREGQLPALTAEAEKLALENPSSVTLLRVLIESYTRQNENSLALETIEKAITLEPENRSYYTMKGSLLARIQDVAGLEDHLRAMNARFPGDSEIKAMLVRILAGTGQIERAEEFLRAEAESSPDDLGPRVSLIGFIRELRGDEAALAEIDIAIEKHESPSTLRALRAGILFDTGNRKQAIAEMQAIVDTDAESDQTSRFKIVLAKMLNRDDNEIGARQLVGEVLTSDPTQIDALKMSAKWKTDADDTDGAIADLRSVLDQAPQDVEAMTMLARAHERAGEGELAQDLLALAVEASNYSPEESLRFARLLVSEDSFRPAEDVLVNALRESPNDLRVLIALGKIYLQTEDWPRAAQVEATMRRNSDLEAEQAATNLRLQILARREGSKQAVELLEQIARENQEDAGPQVLLIRAKVAEGDAEAALEIANTLVTNNPDADWPLSVLGTTQFALRDYDSAVATMQEYLAREPQADRAWLQLTQALNANEQPEEARAAIDRGLEANPDSVRLLWAKASYLERSNDIDSAIDIYEQLYARNSGNLVVANNLASLLATYRDDEESIERAFAIGRRLRGTEVPPFQDTYGWLQYRRGEYQDALTYLEPAAQALSGDAIVQYHLAAVYVALGRNEDAKAQFQRVIEMSEDTDTRPQIETARSELERLSSSEQ